MATMNRLTRDQIINRALDMCDSPRLDEKCRGGSQSPSATITDPSIATRWFQDGMDQAHILYPMAADIATFPLLFLDGVAAYALPSDYIKDYKDGIQVFNSDGNLVGRMALRSLSRLLNYPTQPGSRGMPAIYTVRGSNIEVRPVPGDQAYTGTLYYYKQPAVVGAAVVPSFPDDLMLIDYVYNRGREWLREAEPLTAQAVLSKAITMLISSGIMGEAEPDQIDLDREYFPGDGGHNWGPGWLGGWPQ